MLFHLVLVGFWLVVDASPVVFRYGPFYGPIPGPFAPSVFPIDYPTVSGPVEHIQSKDYYDSGKVLNNYNIQDILKNNQRDSQQSSALGSIASTGNHQIVSDTTGDHGYHSGSIGKIGKGHGKSYAGGTRDYDLESNEGYGNQGATGFNKGHKTTGFHKSYHNVEEGKESKYIDEDHKVAEENYGKKYEDLYGDKGYAGYDNAEGGEDYQTVSRGSSGVRNGLSSAGLQDVKYGEHGRKGQFNAEDLEAKNSRSRAFHDSGLSAAGSKVGYNSNVRPYPPSFSYQ